MTQQKIDDFIKLAEGLKQYEWLKIVHAVQRTYDAASCKLELNDSDKLKNMLMLEFNELKH